MRILLCILSLCSGAFTQAQQIYRVEKGSVDFESDAELEIIKASSTQLKGLFDLKANTFAFSVEISTFEGFNSALQKEHFNENYMESNRFPKAVFSGKILDAADPEKTEQTLRAKGKLSIHGIDKERIISITLKKQGNRLQISSDFNVPLADHGIEIPRIVHQKIAETIQVRMTAQCSLK